MTRDQKERLTKSEQGNETMDDKPRLIEVAFPLKQASVASVHEKNVRHRHISTPAHLACPATAGGKPGGPFGYAPA